MATKSELRDRIRNAFFRTDGAAKEEESAVVAEKILDFVRSGYPKGTAVLMYWPLPDEVDVRRAVAELFDGGYVVVLPVVEGESLRLKIYSGPGNMKAGAFGIMEPQGDAFGGRIGVAFIPGRAFTSDGRRLGRGKGYYDRLLPLLDCPKIGVCFSFQRLEDLPVEPHDISMDGLISSDCKECRGC